MSGSTLQQVLQEERLMWFGVRRSGQKLLWLRIALLEPYFGT